MAKIQNPFYKSKLECPVCKTVNEYDSLRQGSFIESGRDTDFMPMGREWTNPAYQKFNPLLFFTVTCSRCFYTREFNASYKEWQNDTNFKSYRLPDQAKKHLDYLNADDSLIMILGRNIDQSKYPFETAIIKLLLAIYDEKLLDHSSPLDIARFYLRISWLYREKGENREIRNPAELMLSTIQIEIDRLKNDIGGFAGHISPLHQSVTSDFEMVIQSDDKAGISEKLGAAVDNIQKVWMDLNRDIEHLQSVFDDVKKEINLAKSENKVEGGFGEYPDFRDFLYSLRPKWDETPVNETEAMTLALNYYMKAYQSGREIKAGLQQLQAAYLIAELSRRINNLDQAREYFKNASKMAQELIAKNRNDKSITSNAQKIFEMSLEQGRMVKKVEKVKA